MRTRSGRTGGVRLDVDALARVRAAKSKRDSDFVEKYILKSRERNLSLGLNIDGQ